MVTTPNVGVRTFLNTQEETTLVIADMSSIGGVFTPGATGIDRSLFPADMPVSFTTDDAEMVAGCGTGTLRETVDACISEGVVARIVANVPNITSGDNADAVMAKLVGSASSKTGIWAMLGAQDETGDVPDLLIAPGYTALRPGSAANPIATAMDAISERLITAIGICDAPSSTKEAAVEWAADFDSTQNIVCIGQGARISVDGLPVVKSASPHVAALFVRHDKEMGAPYYNPGNQTLKGILGPSRAVSLNVSDPDCEANWLLQRGVNSLVQLTKNRTARSVNSPQGKTFWGFLNTNSDPLWKQIQQVRTVKAVREVIPRTLAQYVGQDLGAHLGVVLLRSLQGFLSDLSSLPVPAILPGATVRFDPNLNSASEMRVGGFVINANFEPTPALLDLKVYLGRQASAFTILADEIQSAMSTYNVSGTLTA